MHGRGARHQLSKIQDQVALAKIQKLPLPAVAPPDSASAARSALSDWRSWDFSITAVQPAVVVADLQSIRRGYSSRRIFLLYSDPRICGDLQVETKPASQADGLDMSRPRGAFCIPCPMLRRCFTISGEVVRARMYATAHGIYAAGWERTGKRS